MHAYNLCVSLMTEVTLAGNPEEIKFMYSDTGTLEFFFFDFDWLTSFKESQLYAKQNPRGL